MKARMWSPVPGLLAGARVNLPGDGAPVRWPNGTVAGRVIEAWAEDGGVVMVAELDTSSPEAVEALGWEPV